MIAADWKRVACFFRNQCDASESGGGTRARTWDQRLKRPMLYQLSYTPARGKTRDDTGRLQNDKPMTRLGERSVTLVSHPLETLVGQSCRGRVGMVGLNL